MLICIDPEYLFPYSPYDDTLDINDIYYMRANAYIRLGDLQKAQDALDNITEGLGDCTSKTVFECLATYNQ